MSVSTTAVRSIPARRYPAFVNVFVPFSLLLAGANLFAEAGINPVPEPLVGDPSLNDHIRGNPTFARVMYSIWLTFLFALPAVILFLLHDLRSVPSAVYRYWQLFWAFGFLAFLIHAYYATGLWFDWDFPQIVERQTALVAVTNYVLLIAWGVDVGVSVVGGQGAGGRWFYRFQWFTHVLFVVAAVGASVVFYFSGQTPKTILSLLFGAALALCVICAAGARLVFGGSQPR